jgi:hypothetical protein
MVTTVAAVDGDGLDTLVINGVVTTGGVELEWLEQPAEPMARTMMTNNMQRPAVALQRSIRLAFVAKQSELSERSDEIASIDP